MKRKNYVYCGHFDQIRHGNAPRRKESPWSLSAESGSPQSGRFSGAHDWLVLSVCQHCRALRQAEAVPILERIRAELDRLSIKLLPKSGLAQAVTYALNQWRALCRYTEDGRLTIDNNVSERRLRDQAIGRKNWMFLGSAEAGPRAAVLCTIIAGAKRHRLEPWAYLHDVILQLSVEASPEILTSLLPDRWALAHPEHVLNHRLEESRQKAQRRDQRRANRRRPK